ncbi:MAG TPA: hypothetical protein VK820_08785 [Steroidobacteraceae bacterium]|jgi:hypothetical protein|nr:hypothetical protein [Steroidobacteraceae bacterium]
MRSSEQHDRPGTSPADWVPPEAAPLYAISRFPERFAALRLRSAAARAGRHEECPIGPFGGATSISRQPQFHKTGQHPPRWRLTDAAIIDITMIHNY